MRMRKRKNLAARMEKTAERLIEQPERYAGQWLASFPPYSRIVVELGCGMGRFACETAAAAPDTLVLALERIPGALVIGLERSVREGIGNIRFILGDAGHLGRFFAPGEIDGLFIHFCDPWPHRKHARRRLMARNFLQIYRPLLERGVPSDRRFAGTRETGVLRFKTDNAPLFAFAQKELAAEGWTVTHCGPDSPPAAVMTEYEIKFRAQGVPIGALTAKP